MHFLCFTKLATTATSVTATALKAAQATTRTKITNTAIKTRVARITTAIATKPTTATASTKS